MEFKTPFTDFSNGEVSDRNLVLSLNPETAKGLTLMENFYTTKTKGFRRRAGTLKGSSPQYIVSSVYNNVRSIPFYIGDDLSFVALMYVSTYQENEDADLGAAYTATGLDISPTFLNLTFDFFKVETTSILGQTERYLNTVTLPLDPTQIFTPLLKEILIPETTSLEWTDLYGFRTTSFQNLLLMCHDSGSVEPFFFSYAADTNVIFPSLHKVGLNQTNRDFYPNAYLSSVLGVPFEQSNLNPNLALRFQRIGSDPNQFTVTAQYFSPVTGAFENWSTVTSVTDKSHPFKNFNTYIRVTIGASVYILRYIITGSTRLEDLSDTTAPGYADSHTFALVVDDGDASQDLFTVVGASGVRTQDFNMETFNLKQGYPDNVLFLDQRLLFFRKGRIFNSQTGNAFFFNQYRFSTTLLDFVSLEVTVPPSTLGYVQRPFLVPYTGVKIASDPFDFIPSVEFLSSKSWVNKSDVLEVGNLSGTTNISGVEDSIYAFNSIKASLGNTLSSRSSLTVKAKNISLFLDQTNLKVYGYFFDGRQRQYISQDLNKLNEDIVRHNFIPQGALDFNTLKITEMSFNVDEDTVYFLLKPSNQIICLRIEREDGVLSWSRLTLGNFDTSVVDIRSSSYVRTNGAQGVQYFVTKKQNQFYLERIADTYPYDEMNVAEVLGSIQIDDLPVYLDFATRYIEALNDTFTIDLFYANKTVDVFAEGFWIKDVSVSSLGVIVLDREVESFVVGFRYKSKAQTMHLEPPVGRIGGSLDMIKHINRQHLRLINSYAGLIGTKNGTNLEKIPYDADNMVVGVSLKLFTGDKEVSTQQESSDDVRCYIETDAPYPFELTAWTIKGEVNDG
jgi:hypothetical protein